MVMVQQIPPGDGACSLPPAASGADGGLVVYFDGACPLCRREIGVYRGLEPRQPLRFVDVSRADGAELPSPRAAMLARFHVRVADGRLVDGARAFLALWTALPGWRWLARAGALPGVAPVLEWGYRGFLRVRPALQRALARGRHG